MTPHEFYEALTAYSTAAAALATFLASAIALWLANRGTRVKLRGSLRYTTIIGDGRSTDVMEFRATNLGERVVFVNVFGLRVRRSLMDRLRKKRRPVLAALWDHPTSTDLSKPVAPGMGCTNATDKIQIALNSIGKALAESNLSRAKLSNRLVAIAGTPWKEVDLKIYEQILKDILDTTDRFRTKTQPIHGAA